MKELIEAVLGYFPRYLRDLGALVAGPKAFVGARNEPTDQSLSDALLFIGVTIAIFVIVLTVVRPSGREIYLELAAQAVQVVVAASLTALFLFVSWRMVGGRAPMLRYFITHCYYASVAILVFSGIGLLGQGVAELMAPEALALIEAGETMPPDHAELETLIIVRLSEFGLAILAVSIWGFVGWGAYRELNEVGRGRSAIAFLIAGVLSYGLLPITFFLGLALSQPAG